MHPDTFKLVSVSRNCPCLVFLKFLMLAFYSFCTFQVRENETGENEAGEREIIKIQNGKRTF